MTGLPGLSPKLATQDFNTLLKGHLPEVRAFELTVDEARKQGERDIQMANGNIKNEYQKRIADTRETREKSEHQLHLLQIERTCAEQTRKDIMVTLQEFTRPLQLNMIWIGIQSGRPKSPDIESSESVDSAIKQSNHDLKTSIASLGSHLANLNGIITDLKAQEAALEKSILGKTSTLLIDRACMEEMIDPPDELKGKTTKRPLMQKVGLRTETEYMNRANTQFSAATALVEKSANQRRAIAGIVRSLHVTGKLGRSTMVLDALSNRVKRNAHAHASLEANSKMLEGELSQLDKRKAALDASIERVEIQLRNAKHRQDLCGVKPTSEAARAGVEEVLEVEVINMTNTVAGLKKQREEFTLKRKRLLLLLSQLQDEMKAKSLSIAMDKQCLDLKLPTVEQSMSSPAAATVAECGPKKSAPKSPRQESRPLLPEVIRNGGELCTVNTPKQTQKTPLASVPGSSIKVPKPPSYSPRQPAATRT